MALGARAVVCREARRRTTFTDRTGGQFGIVTGPRTSEDDASCCRVRSMPATLHPCWSGAADAHRSRWLDVPSWAGVRLR